MSGTGLLGVSGPEHREIVSQDVGANHGRLICGGLSRDRRNLLGVPDSRDCEKFAKMS